MSNRDSGVRPPDIRLDVWQFVRLMVQLEETLAAAPGGGKGSALSRLFERWEDVWVDLDARLVDLGQHDMDGFADLMMNQEVVLDAVTDAERRLIAGELEKVVRSIAGRLSVADDPGDVEDLSFERDALRDRIGGL